MLREVCSSIYNNKNILMLVSVFVYIISLYGTLSGYISFIAAAFSLIMVLAYIKNLFPLKIIFIWIFIFYLGIFNTSSRLKENDELLNITPINATIYGKIISVPQYKSNIKTTFFFNVDKIEHDGVIKNFNKEKILVTINTNHKFQIYDSYKIRGRLASPFKAGNPSQFDYGNYLRNFNTYSVFYGHNPYSMRNSGEPCFEKTAGSLSFIETSLQKINNYRDKILEVHSQYVNSPNLEILGGIVFGDDAVAPPDNIRQSFINSGLLHILAASGMNVAFIYSFFFFILNILRIPFRVNILTCALAVIVYVFMTGLGPSVVRAALMLLFVLFGKLIDRDAHSISLLSVVALIMLVYNPMYINDVGFQLSFIVTFGLLLMAPLIIKHKNRIVNSVLGAVTIPIIAQFWVIPIQIFYFNNISIYAVFANIMSVPIISVISFGGFISSLLSLITPIANFVCKIFDIVLNPLISILVNISDFWGNLPNATLQTTHPNPVQLIIYFAILICIACLLNPELRQKYLKTIKYSLITLILVLLISTISSPNHNLEVTAFDVGNADAFLIKTPQNKYIIIDTGKSGYNGGKSQAEAIILKYFKDKGIKNIDKMIITHFDNDHCGGATDLLNGLKVNEIFVNNINHHSKAASEIYKTAKTNNVKITKAENNQIIEKEKGMEIINYISDNINGVGDNDSSIITLLKYNQFTMLFTGDAGIDALKNLKKWIPQNITVLKVGHHGAIGVINKELAEYLNPKFSIISTGENKFGHPSVYTIKSLKNSTILRTDINNSIKFIVTNKKIDVLCYDSKKRKYIDLKRKTSKWRQKFL